MDDLISREEATALIRAESDISMQNWKEHDDECSYGEMCAHDRDVDILQSLPSAQPEIIRCKDCKHWMIAYLAISGKHGCNIMRDYTASDDYCFKAERKDDE